MREFAHVEHRHRRQQADEQQKQQREQAERRDRNDQSQNVKWKTAPEARHVVMRERVPDDQDAFEPHADS